MYLWNRHLLFHLPQPALLNHNNPRPIIRPKCRGTKCSSNPNAHHTSSPHLPITSLLPNPSPLPPSPLLPTFLSTIRPLSIPLLPPPHSHLTTPRPPTLPSPAHPFLHPLNSNRDPLHPTTLLPPHPHTSLRLLTGSPTPRPGNACRPQGDSLRPNETPTPRRRGGSPRCRVDLPRLLEDFPHRCLLLAETLLLWTLTTPAVAEVEAEVEEEEVSVGGVLRCLPPKCPLRR
mmetsp:Transcript_22482/g.31271  ORF Transcript_22482/g.31271 Transcript_22482/m.31271 type:complete len:231 (-) Transcript_22482:413-1105(-)